MFSAMAHFAHQNIFYQSHFHPCNTVELTSLHYMSEDFWLCSLLPSLPFCTDSELQLRIKDYVDVCNF